MMKKLKWGNLKFNRCPKCDANLSYDEKNAICQCGFKIALDRMNEIVTNKIAREVDREYENEQN